MTEPKIKSNVQFIGSAPEKYSQERIERDYLQRLNNMDKVIKQFAKKTTRA
ncbi:hypothetical protein [Shouchella shacheensis]|uniref:hypothetical protein n=1 Tax=Shouchella shacheensis TaxID=1649580 RepID=UPI000AE9E259|nr:hypothetical protein [Shouchella shacheensis]